MQPHVVRQGETVASIVSKSGAGDPDSVWNDDMDKALRELRGDPVGQMLPQIDIGIAKCNLAALGKLAESLGTKIAVYTGVGIGVLLAAYCAFEALSDAMKSDTEKAIDSILESLKARLSYRDKTVIQYLGLEAQLAAVKDALDGWDCFELRPNPAGSPTREELKARMKGLGFKDDLAAGMVESADVGVPLPPMLMVP